MTDLDNLPGDVCPIDVIALRDGKCPFCGWTPEQPAEPVEKWSPHDDVPGIHGW